MKIEETTAIKETTAAVAVKKVDAQVKVQKVAEVVKRQESFELRAYREVDRRTISWEERIRLWNEIIRGRKLTESEWAKMLTEYQLIKKRFVLSRKAFTREDLSLIRKWMEKRSGRACSDGEFRSWVTTFYKKNNCSCSKADYNNVTMIRTGGVISAETKKTVLNKTTTKAVDKCKKVAKAIVAKSDSKLVKRTALVKEVKPVQAAQVTVVTKTVTAPVVETAKKVEMVVKREEASSVTSSSSSSSSMTATSSGATIVKSR